MKDKIFVIGHLDGAGKTALKNLMEENPNVPVKPDLVPLTCHHHGQFKSGQERRRERRKNKRK